MKGGRTTIEWNYGTEILIKTVVYLTLKEYTEKTKELLRKPKRLSFPL